jgi:hypothetical protein
MINSSKAHILALLSAMPPLFARNHAGRPGSAGCHHGGELREFRPQAAPYENYDSYQFQKQSVAAIRSSRRSISSL